MTTEDAYRAWVIVAARTSFMEARNAIDFLRSEASPKHFHLVLYAGAVVTYGRPFGKMFGIPSEFRFSDRDVPKEFLPAHKRVLTIRDKVLAHSDLHGLQPDENGGLNQVTFYFGDSVLQPGFLRKLDISGPYLDEFHALADSMLDLSKRRFEILEPILRSKATNGPGEYVLRVQPDGNSHLEFIPPIG